jgi:hypothetical protein
MTTALPSAVIDGSERSPLLDPVGVHQVLHRLMDACQFASGDREFTHSGGTDRKHHSVVAPQEVRGVDVGADVDAGVEDRPLGAHLVESPVQLELLHFEGGDAVPQ